MVKGKNIEQRVVYAFMSFAEEKELEYDLRSNILHNKAPKRGISLKLENSNKEEIFSHLLQIDPITDKIISDRTTGVGRDIESRKKYLEFIGYMKEKEGIKLENSFEDLWAVHPDKYPVDYE